VDVREMNQSAAERLVAIDNDAPAALVLPAGTSQRFRAGKASTLQLRTDPAQWQGLKAIRLIFLLVARKVETPTDPFGEKLLSIEERSLTTRQLSIPFLEQRIPGLTVMFVLLSMVLGLAFGVQEDKERRISYRLAIAPVSRVTLLGGKLLARVLLGSAQLFVLLGFGHVVYGLELGDSPVTILLVGACTVLSFAGFALVFAMGVRSREQIIPLGLALGLILAAVGGCWWPFYKQPHWLQFIGRGMMTSWSMFAIQDVMIRNRGVLSVAPKLLALVAQGLLWLAVAVGLMRRAES
jgi:ABC-2 type transport system permease protein